MNPQSGQLGTDGGQGAVDDEAAFDAAALDAEALDAEALDAVFAALADPTRRAILARLAEGDATVMELGRPFDMSQPAISKHLKVLEHAGLVSRGRDAQRRPRRLEPQALVGAVAWLQAYKAAWEQTYERLDGYLLELQEREEHHDR